MKTTDFIKPRAGNRSTTVVENASAGATGAASVAVSMSQEGTLPTKTIKRQQEYAKNSFGGMKPYKAANK
jgi:hypothetical protein